MAVQICHQQETRVCRVISNSRIPGTLKSWKSTQLNGFFLFNKNSVENIAQLMIVFCFIGVRLHLSNVGVETKISFGASMWLPCLYTESGRQTVWSSGSLSQVISALISVSGNYQH